MKNRFDLIIFDWDGTLMDSVDWIVHCIQQAAMNCECAVPDVQAVRDIVGLSIENAMKQLFPDEESDIRQKIAADYAKTFFTKKIGPDDLFPGVHEMLKQFRDQGYHLAVATGKKSTGLHAAMNATGAAGLFSTTRCADQTASKPNPLMLDEIMAELGVDKQRTLMVGDSVHDLQMALNAQVASVGVTCGAHSAATLQKYNPLLCVNYPTDLIGII
ncbi:HAD-IA family hydrolase [Methylomonas sp. 11b]|uniref:HAD-IA family hydrolase n=1 Tax=Methylomonas sp. 11b TaxID=1168169 RepID=UPI00047A45C2|nr:HAD-IA family hydrolase [Methylomonas sp. 11b]